MSKISENFDDAVKELAKNAGISEEDAKALVGAIQEKAKNADLNNTFIKRLMGDEVAGSDVASTQNACGGGSNAC